jgi:prepilin-type N-terminal cleavage/methylation domain-containing protein
MFIKDKKGFTLIELLVTISVISILATIVLTTLNGAVKKSKRAKVVRQFQEIEKAFIMSYFDENRSTWWREGELNLGTNPTLKKIIEKETGPLSTFSDYFSASRMTNELSNSHYHYDHDNDTGADCDGGSSNWAKGVNLSIEGMTLKEKKEIDLYIDKEENFKCGKITYGNYEGGALYWRISDIESAF